MTDAAMRYNGLTKDWSATGSPAVIDTIHPVDQGVALSVLIPQGSIQSSPTTGSLLHTIQYLGDPSIQDKVEAIVRESNPLARFLSDGLAAIERVVVDTSSDKLLVAVYYKNLATKQRDKVNFSAS